MLNTDNNDQIIIIMRKLFSLFLALVATASLSAYNFQSGDLCYNITSNNTVELDYAVRSITTVTIPENVTYNGTTYNVTSIGSSAFYDCSALTSVTIPNSITSIGGTAFYNCESLTKTNYTGDIAGWCNIKFGDSYANPMYYSHNFYINDQEIKDLVIQNSVDSIHNYAFCRCSGLTSVTIPNSVTSIGGLAFQNCSSLTSPVYNAHCFAYMPTSFKGTYAIPEGIKQISGGAFYDCSALTSVTIPNSVTSIGEYAFYNCSALTSVTIPNSVTSIGQYAFSGTGIYNDNSNWENDVLYISNCLIKAKTNISGTYTIKENTQLIAGSAFRYCSSLTTIAIPNSVISIGHYAFDNCSALTSVTIPNSVTSIGNYAFVCSSLTSMMVESGNTTYDSRDNCNAIIKTASNTLIAGCQNTIIPNSVTNIGSGAFYDCSALTSITIQKNVTTIGNFAFQYCSSLTAITIPNSVTSIGINAFEGCISLTSIDVESGNTTYDSRDNCNAIIETTTNTLITGCQNTTIPNSVMSIGDYAFDSCSKLLSITIPNSVTSIGEHAFFYCNSLTSITIPESVTSIGNYAFDGCSSLTSITIPNSVTNIGDYAFANCSSCTSITIPDGVTIIGSGIFAGCSKLTSITIPNRVTCIGDRAFQNCSSFTSVTIPNSVTSIGNMAFYNCSSLNSIAWNAKNCADFEWHSAPFRDSDSIISFSFGDSVEHIPAYLCYNMDKLTSIICKATIPPTIGQSAFKWGSGAIPVYVPCGCVSAYKAASAWKEFTNIQERLAEYTISVSSNDTLMGTAKVDYNTFCEGNQITATANKGYHFVQWSDGVTDNPRTITLTQDTVLTAEFALTIAGQCGKNLYWVYDTYTTTLAITGSGDMYNERPWGLLAKNIAKVQLPYGITHIGNDAFSECLNLREITIPATVTSIGNQSFAGCRNLRNINCYPLLPPYATPTSFANYNVNLNVPCDYLEDYQYDIVFGSFKYINCISSDEVEDTEDVEIDAGTTDVTIIWPTKENAYTYTIVIKKNGQVVCTLVFDAFGRLLNISFAPGRDGNHPAQYAEQAGNGYRFTVTGLEEGTDYTYDITVKDASNKTINSHSGKFTTESLTAVYNITTNNANIQKILRNGQLIILRDGVEYNAMGQEL